VSIRDDIRKAIEKAPRDPLLTAENQTASVCGVVEFWLLDRARHHEGTILHPDCDPAWEPELHFAAKELRWMASKLTKSDEPRPHGDALGERKMP
jgi:hypothetical protein